MMKIEGLEIIGQNRGILKKKGSIAFSNRPNKGLYPLIFIVMLRE